MNDKITRLEREVSRLRTLVLLLVRHQYVQRGRGVENKSLREEAKKAILEMYDVVGNDEGDFREKVLEPFATATDMRELAQDLKFSELYMQLSDEDQRHIDASLDPIESQIDWMEKTVKGDEDTALYDAEVHKDQVEDDPSMDYDHEEPRPPAHLKKPRAMFTRLSTIRVLPEVELALARTQDPVALQSLEQQMKDLVDRHLNTALTPDRVKAVEADIYSMLQALCLSDPDIGPDFWSVEIDVYGASGRIDARIIPKVLLEIGLSNVDVVGLTSDEGDSYLASLTNQGMEKPLTVSAPTEIEALVGLAKLLIVRYRIQEIH